MVRHKNVDILEQAIREAYSAPARLFESHMYNVLQLTDSMSAEEIDQAEARCADIMAEQ